MTDREAREIAERPWWADLDPADWLFDGHPIKIGWMDAWRKLDWSKAWLDMGPSPAGNVGPYFHVPDDDDDAVHRLYPKALRKPNLRAMLEGVMSVAIARATAEERERAAKVAEEWLRADELRLHMGELTAQEVRTAQALQRRIAAAIRLPPASHDEEVNRG